MRCRNCDLEMGKKVDPIVFSPTPEHRYWWLCPKCGARIYRTPEPHEAQNHFTVYALQDQKGVIDSSEESKNNEAKHKPKPIT